MPPFSPGYDGLGRLPTSPRPFNPWSNWSSPVGIEPRPAAAGLVLTLRGAGIARIVGFVHPALVHFEQRLGVGRLGHLVLARDLRRLLHRNRDVVHTGLGGDLYGRLRRLGNGGSVKSTRIVSPGFSTTRETSNDTSTNEPASSTQ